MEEVRGATGTDPITPKRYHKAMHLDLGIPSLSPHSRPKLLPGSPTLLSPRLRLVSPSQRSLGSLSPAGASDCRRPRPLTDVVLPAGGVSPHRHRSLGGQQAQQALLVAHHVRAPVRLEPHAARRAAERTEGSPRRGYMATERTNSSAQWGDTHMAAERTESSARRGDMADITVT